VQVQVVVKLVQGQVEMMVVVVVAVE